jgi:hypothetical protein
MSINIPTSHKANVSVPYGQLQPIVEWCDRNCTSEWRYMEDHNDQYNSWEFFFESEKDYVAFLIWKK